MKGIVITKDAIIDLKEVRFIRYSPIDDATQFVFNNETKILVRMSYEQFDQMKCKLMDKSEYIWIEDIRKEDK